MTTKAHPDTRRADTQWVTAQEVADYLGMHLDTIYDAMKSRGLKHVRLGPGTIRSRYDWVDEWVEAHTYPKPPA